MRFVPTILLSISLAALALTPAGDAAACGGCFHEMQDMESTQVSGHRMIFSVSATQSTLWDQISYAGNPASFAWVLPTKGMIDLQLSSDALFANLEQLTQVTVNSPPYGCPPPPNCGGFGTATSTTSSTGTGDPGPVTVIAEKVVGPYDTVQLSSQDPAALKSWLLDHGYAIPADIGPILDAYVAEGFDFLALKLVPGQGVQSMRPVRVTSMGGGVSLPLRMVAAGTGAKVPINLWVFGEGRYQPANFPSFTVQDAQIVWDWDSSSSNYATLVQAGFSASKNKGWLIDAAEPFSMYALSDGLTSLAQTNPVESGYADDMGNGAPEACAADLAALFGEIPPASLWISRLRAELTREALGADLSVSASPDQTALNRYLTAQSTIGTPPQCPSYPPCPDTTSSTSTSGAGGSSGDGSGGSSEQPRAGSCAIGEPEGTPALFAGLLLPLGLWMARRRRSA